MSIWDKLAAWVKSWEGILAIIGAIGVALATTRKMAAGAWKRAYALVHFFLNIDTYHSEILQWLKALDRGQLDDLQTRQHLMDADERAAFFKCDTKGNCTWVSELWRHYTGLSAEEAMGFGWEMGIDESERPRVLQNWQLAIDHSRRYTDTVTYCDRRTGKCTKVKVTGNPVRDNDGTVLSWNGIAKPI